MTNHNEFAGERHWHEPMAVDADTLNRVVKLALDTDEVPTPHAAYQLFRSYRLLVRVGQESAISPAHQAALLTVVNTGRRAMLGGMFVEGDLDVPLVVPIPGLKTLAGAVEHLGGTRVSHAPAGLPSLVIGTVADMSSHSPIALAVTFEDWRGGVIPISEGRRLAECTTIIPAAILAGALAVSEVFQHLRGNPMAGRRSVGLSLWSPGNLDWENAPAGPASIVLPSRLWLIGLGHLGQAFLWTLGLLPYKSPGEVELVLQDFDRLTLANDSTSLLTTPRLIGQTKTRAMAAWAEARGFRTRLVERIFPGGIIVADDEPRLALGGVDNPAARAAYEDAGFDHIIDAGLGAGPSEYLALRLHSFPASTTARAKWGGSPANTSDPLPRASAYDNLARDGLDACGLVRLASRTVGAPFVGATAAALVISEVLRRLNCGPKLEILDMTLRDPTIRSIVADTRSSDRFNPGFTT